MRFFVKVLTIFATVAMAAGCVSVDHRVWTEKVDPGFSKDFTGVYLTHPSYASTEPHLKHGHLRDDLGFGWDSRDAKSINSVRLQHEENGDLTFIWGGARS